VVVGAGGVLVSRYLALFHGAWAGDVEAVRHACELVQLDAPSPDSQGATAATATGRRQDRCLVATVDVTGCSVLDLAVLRGHVGVCRELLRLAQQQHTPAARAQVRSPAPAQPPPLINNIDLLKTQVRLCVQPTHRGVSNRIGSLTPVPALLVPVLRPVCVQ